MSKTKLIVVTLSLFAFISSGSGTNKHPANAEGFAAIEQDIEDQFGNNVYYVDFDKSVEKLGELVELSSKKLTKEKNIDNPILDMAFIKFPKMEV